MALLQIKNLDVGFATADGEVRAVTQMNLSVHAGEALAIVGESGSGKTQTVMAVMGLLANNGHASGQILFKGMDLLQMSVAELNQCRGREIAMIFQNPMTSLNPYLSIEKQLIEVVMHHQGLSKTDARARAIDMLKSVHIPDPERRIQQFPHQYSGGMRQRVMIAMGLLCQPDLLIADEPTTALDVTVQAQISQLLVELRENSNTAIILITHDLGVVAGLCDRVVVMYAGAMVESGSVEQIYYQPKHPYTRGLLDSVPRLDQPGEQGLHGIPGNPPDLQSIPPGCRYRERCPLAVAGCTETPPLRAASGGHVFRCFLDGQ